jgi:uncharacterized repeat protein (TIGR03803 family)
MKAVESNSLRRAGAGGWVLAKTVVIAFAFSFNFDGTVIAAEHYQSVHSFGAADQSGYTPKGELLLASNGVFYGTTYSGGSNNLGTVYQVKVNGDYKVLHHFMGSDGCNPQCALLEMSDGSLGGTCYTGGIHNAGVIFKMKKDGSSFELLHQFSTNGIDGRNPASGLIIGFDGSLYGNTCYGGITNMGTIFKLGQDGTGYTTLHHFLGCCIGGNDGGNPEGRLFQAHDGLLYGGTTGVIYKMDTNGTVFSIVYPIGSQYAGVLELDGFLYGTTPGYGSVFKVSTNGSGYTNLHSYSGYSEAPLIQGRDGFLYGTTHHGGSNFAGTVFRIATNGTSYEIIHHCLPFGTQPLATVTEGTNGTLYCPMTEGGPGNVGSIMNLSNGVPTMVHVFSKSGNDVRSPGGRLIQAKDGTLYGVSGAGGSYDSGTIFSLKTDGSSVTILHEFKNPPLECHRRVV